jgi:hypothetical protein
MSSLGNKCISLSPSFVIICPSHPAMVAICIEIICAVGGIASDNRAKRSRCTRGWC